MRLLHWRTLDSFIPSIRPSSLAFLFPSYWLLFIHPFFLFTHSHSPLCFRCFQVAVKCHGNIVTCRQRLWPIANTRTHTLSRGWPAAFRYCLSLSNSYWHTDPLHPLSASHTMSHTLSLTHTHTHTHTDLWCLKYRSRVPGFLGLSVQSRGQLFWTWSKDWNVKYQLCPEKKQIAIGEPLIFPHHDNHEMMRQ